MSSVLGPSTVLLAMQSAVRSVFGTSAWVAYTLTYGPTVIYIFICLKLRSQTQLTIAMILSAIYAMLMMAVIAGTIVEISEEGFFTPSAVFMYVLVGIFLAAGLFHPHELTDLFWGLLYFICIPAGYLFLIIYAICNLNNVSWGTRESQKAVLENQEVTDTKKKDNDELNDVSKTVINDIVKQAKHLKLGEKSCLNLIPNLFRWINNLIILRSMESVQNISKTTVSNDNKDNTPSLCSKPNETFDDESWADDNKKTKYQMDDDERRFWNALISNYLKPLQQDEEHRMAVEESLKDFRNKVAFAFFFANGLWLVIMTAMNEIKALLNISIPSVGGTVIIIEPLGLLFLSIFAILLLLQFCGMVKHRYGTFLHLLATTTLRGDVSDPEVVINRVKLLSSPDVNENLKIQKISRNSRRVAFDSSKVNGSSKFSRTRRMEYGKSFKTQNVSIGNRPFNLRRTFKQNYSGLGKPETITEERF